ncbi:hypothetical protein [Actinophytocola sediminis]
MRPAREVLVGVAAGVLAWAGMAGWALLGVTLAGLGAATAPAAVALAVGGSAGLTRDVALTGSISVLPLGVSLVGAVLLTAWLTSWRRVGGAVLGFLVVLVAGLVAVASLPAGELTVQAWPTVLGSQAWLFVVLGVRVAMWWRPWVGAVVLVLLGAAALATVVGAVASVAGGARMLGTMLLAAPNLLCVALTRGLGVPWTVRGPDLPMPTIDTGGLGPLAVPGWPLAVAAAVLVVLVAVFAGWHTPWVGALCLGGMTALGGAEVALRAGPFGIALGVRGDVLVAIGVGLLAGTAACLLVRAFRSWHGQRT